MDAPDTGKEISDNSPVVTLKLPGVSIAFSGFLALIPFVILLGLAALVVFYVARSATWSWLWISGGLWILFVVYWTVAAAGAAPTKSAESTGSRQLHQLLMYGALALAFWRTPGLGGRWLPRGAYIVAIGLAIQVGAGLLAVWARRHLGRKLERRNYRQGWPSTDPHRSVPRSSASHLHRYARDVSRYCDCLR